jgi:hypothetical protein
LQQALDRLNFTPSQAAVTNGCQRPRPTLTNAYDPSG